MISHSRVIRHFALAALVLIFGLQTGVSEAASRKVRLTLLLTCDIYEMAESKGRGGFARVAGVIADERKRVARDGSHLIVAHAGDTLSPSLMSGFDQGAHIIELTNRLGLDVFVPGNHEFDFGEDVFRKRMAEATFPILAANLRDRDGKQLDGIADTRIFDVDGVKVGVIGLTAENSVTRSSPGSLTFSSSIETAREGAAKLRSEGADLVVAVAHTSWQDDVRLVNDGALDLLLSGDDHDLVVFYNGATAWIEAKSDGEVVVAADLEISVDEAEGQRKVAWHPRFRIIDSADVAPDAGVLARVNEYQLLLDSELDVDLGTTATALDGRKSLVRTGEAAIGNLIADAMRHSVGADVALTNGGGIRGDKIYEPGSKLTRRDILREMPFGNKVVLVEISGKDLLALLENAYRYAPKPNGRFGHISGMRVEVDTNAVPGKRVIAAYVGETALDLAATYKLATNDFIGRGKEGADAILNAKVMLGPLDGKLMANAVMAYVRQHGSVAPVIDQRVKLR